MAGDELGADSFNLYPLAFMYTQSYIFNGGTMKGCEGDAETTLIARRLMLIRSFRMDAQCI